MKPERVQETTIPFSYLGWDESGGDYGDVQFYNVEFTENWGPIKKGDKFDCVIVEHSKGNIHFIRNSLLGKTVDQSSLKWHAVPNESQL